MTFYYSLAFLCMPSTLVNARRLRYLNYDEWHSVCFSAHDAIPMESVSKMHLGILWLAIYILYSPVVSDGTNNPSIHKIIPQHKFIMQSGRFCRWFFSFASGKIRWATPLSLFLALPDPTPYKPMKTTFQHWFPYACDLNPYLISLNTNTICYIERFPFFLSAKGRSTLLFFLL